ncbi:hypothetical protein JCM17380_16190 [Desulfosporosinus burensis]
MKKRITATTIGISILSISLVGCGGGTQTAQTQTAQTQTAQTKTAQTNQATKNIDSAQDGKYTYSVKDGKAKITKYDTTIEPSGEFLIPSTLGGFPVTGIDNMANYDNSAFKGITSIKFPQEVTSIGMRAFENFTGLTTISIPQGSIGPLAFNGCTGLTSIYISQGVTSIDEMAFIYCKGLTTISIPQSVASIGSEAFRYCTGLTSITINSATTKIDTGYSGVVIEAKATIIGHDPSTAKDYAMKHGNKFVVIN